MRKAIVLGVLALAGTLASPAFADEFSGFRMGMAFSSDKFQGDFNFAPIAQTEIFNENRFGYGLFGGWAFNRYLAFEGGIQSGASANQNVFPTYAALYNVVAVAPAVDSPPAFKVHNGIKSLQISAVGSVWIGKKFALFGRLGGTAWKGETSISVGDADGPPAITEAAHNTGFAPLGGIGIQTVLDGALMRFEYQYADIGDMTKSFSFSQTSNSLSSLTFSIVWIL